MASFHSQHHASDFILAQACKKAGLAFGPELRSRREATLRSRIPINFHAGPINARFNEALASSAQLNTNSLILANKLACARWMR
jgi:hypothetical protein